MTLDIVKSKIAALKVSTNIITSITALPTGLAPILVVMSVSVFKTVVIIYASQSVML
jgi:hypothetical protein